MRSRQILAALAIVGVPFLSGSAVAQQRGNISTACSTSQAGIAMTFTRCREKGRDFVLPKTGNTTDPAAVGKPYGSWNGSFGGQPSPAGN
jgi:hypothetical protein